MMMRVVSPRQMGTYKPLSYLRGDTGWGACFFRGSKREFGEGLALGAVTTARTVEEAEAVVDRRGRAGLRLRRPSVGPAL